MPGGNGSDGGVGQGICERSGGLWWNDAVVFRHHDQRRSPDVLGSNGFAINVPVSLGGGVFHVPVEQAFPGHWADQGHPVVKPVFKGDKVSGLSGPGGLRPRA